MLGHSDSPVEFSQSFEKGDKVRILRGNLKGLEGEVIITPEGKHVFCILVDFLGSARISIHPSEVEKIPAK